MAIEFGTGEAITFPSADPQARPQQLLLAFLGGLLYGPDDRPIPTKVFIDTLEALGVSSVATRATLTRMVERDLFTKVQQGRVTYYSLTDRSRSLLVESASRVRAEDPFQREEGVWTLLSFSLPESRRDVRHQLRARLTWAGFSSLRDGLWIAAGRPDVEQLLDELPLERDDLHSLDAFTAQPLPTTDIAGLIARAWDLDRLRTAHERFLDRWDTNAVADVPPIAAYVLLLSDWLTLLRTDPGLPQEHLPADWPAKRSVDTYKRHSRVLSERAQEALAQELRTPPR